MCYCIPHRKCRNAQTHAVLVPVCMAGCCVQMQSICQISMQVRTSAQHANAQMQMLKCTIAQTRPTYLPTYLQLHTKPANHYLHPMPITHPTLSCLSVCLSIMPPTHCATFLFPINAHASTCTCTCIHSGEEVWLSGAAPIPNLKWDSYKPGSKTAMSTPQQVDNADGCAADHKPNPPGSPNCGCQAESDPTSCANACEQDDNCTAYTFHDKSLPAPWSGLCCLRSDGVWNPVEMKQHVRVSCTRVCVCVWWSLGCCCWW